MGDEEQYRDFRSCQGTLGIDSESNLWIKNCEITFNENGIYVSHDSCLYAYNCVFQGGDEAGSGIKASVDTDTVVVSRCLFTRCGNACNEKYCPRVEGEAGCIHIFANSQQVSLKLKCLS